MKKSRSASASEKPKGRPTQPPWAASEGSCARARALIDEADEVEAEMVRKWGAGRLRLVVPPAARERYDQRRADFERAITTGDLADVEDASAWWIKAQRGCDEIAEAHGADPIEPVVWEHTLPSGETIAIVRTWAELVHLHVEGRRVTAYTLAQVAEALHALSLPTPAEQHDGAEVLRPVRDRIWSPSLTDPQLAILEEHDAGA